MDDSKGLSGTSSTRVGNARLDVVDVDSRQVILTLAQQQAGFVFSAPTLIAFVGMVVKEVKARYCQLH
ncbi:hypothetical protein E7T09_20195 [Deinococcus sp. KSM4-11]|uniref:hypothetical protein n=1 Tax=Deinococcus sp. KSM4-11 TaxID=2568654 RepID=UPI0010A5136F|nr:hypothetical protein [Deinococcus sp. KSM4-11]THF84337.1 hypothetical protein E7T09_20195 [Deinococcus sp. KSM4-11]